MDRFFKELLLTARAVSLGRTPEVLARLEAIPAERLLAFEAVIGLAIGLWASIRAAAPLRLIGYPVLLVIVTVIWAFVFAASLGIKRERMAPLYSLFIGSSLFLLPGILPFIGPMILPALLIGWPFALARFLAAHLQLAPGKVLVLLVIPPAALWLVLQAVLFILSRTLLLL